MVMAIKIPFGDRILDAKWCFSFEYMNRAALAVKSSDWMQIWVFRPHKIHHVCIYHWNASCVQNHLQSHKAHEKGLFDYFQTSGQVAILFSFSHRPIKTSMLFWVRTDKPVSLSAESKIWMFICHFMVYATPEPFTVLNIVNIAWI